MLLLESKPYGFMNEFKAIFNEVKVFFSMNTCSFRASREVLIKSKQLIWRGLTLNLIMKTSQFSLKYLF